MSLFSVGGTAGFAAAPAVAGWLMHQFGRPGLLALAVPGVATAAWAWRQQDHLRGLQPHASGRAATGHARDEWGRFAWLGAAVSARSIAVAGLSTFVPLYIVQRLGASPAAGASALSVFLGAGVVGNLTGGALADRFGRVRLAQGSLALATALLLPLLVAPSVGWAYAVLAVAGYAIFAPFSAMTVLGQSLLPHRIGTASGVTVGLAVTIGGAAAPVLGAIADRAGLRAMLAGLVFVPLVAASLLLALPRERGRTIAEGDA
jgi:FSR family fosmidomycin resistance protein-like MFS transporter